MANGFVTSRPSARAGSDTAGWPIDNSGYVGAIKFVAPGSGALSVTEIGAWFNNNGSGAAMRVAIFTHDSVNDCPESMVSNSESGTLTESTSTVSIHYSALSNCSITGGQTYWLVGFNGSSTGFDQRTVSGGDFKGVRGATPYTWPTGASWHSYDDSDTTIELGLYAIYSAGSSGADLAAASTCACTASASLTTSVTLGAAPSCSVAVQAQLTTQVRMAAAVTAAVTASADLTTQTRLAAAVTCSASLSASLTTQITMAAAALCAASASGTIGSKAELTAQAICSCSISADLTTSIELSASARCSCTAQADLTAGTASIPLAASVVCSSIALANLTTQILMSAVANLSATATASLFEEKPAIIVPPALSEGGGRKPHKKKKQSDWIPWPPPERIESVLHPETVENPSVDEAERIVREYQELIDDMQKALAEDNTPPIVSGQRNSLSLDFSTPLKDAVSKISERKKQEVEKLKAIKKQREDELFKARLALDVANLKLTIAIEQEEEAVMAALMAVLHDE